MTNNNQTERVSDEELDQMIWKLERDGMTRTCYPDLLKKVEALTRYDIFDVYASSSEIDEVDGGKYLKREDVIRLLGGDA